MTLILQACVIICVWIQKMDRTNLLTDLQNIGSVHDKANSIFSTVFEKVFLEMFEISFTIQTRLDIRLQLPSRKI